MEAFTQPKSKEELWIKDAQNKNPALLTVYRIEIPQKLGPILLTDKYLKGNKFSLSYLLLKQWLSIISKNMLKGHITVHEELNGQYKGTSVLFSTLNWLDKG